MSRKQHVTVERNTGKHFGGYQPPSQRSEHIVQKELGRHQQKANRHSEAALLGIVATFVAASVSADQIDISAPIKCGAKAPVALHVAAPVETVAIVEKSNPDHAGEIAMAEYEAWRNGEISTEDFLAKKITKKHGLLAEWSGVDEDVETMFEEFSGLNPEDRQFVGWSKARENGLVDGYDHDDLAEENTQQYIFG